MIQEMNSKEQHRFEMLAALDAQLLGGQEHLGKRLRTLPNGWRDYRLALTTTGRVVQEIYKTMPTKSIEHMVQLMKYGEAIVRMKPVGGNSPLQPVDTRDLRLLINIAVEAECFPCSKSRAEIKGCKLRKALMLIAPPTDVNLGECPYRYVAEHNPVGDYI